MKPYYQESEITIYHGDCREILPEVADIDLIVTDPPYGLSFNNGDLAHKWESVFGGNRKNESARPIANDEDEAGAEILLREMIRAAKPNLARGACCCCCGGGGGPRPLFARWTLALDEEIGFKHAVVWDKGGLGMGLHFRRSYEFMLIAQNGNPAHRWNGGATTSNVWRIPKIIPREHEHPTEKPKGLMAMPISIFSDRGDLVVDPFMGGGATLRAAKDLRRKAIGIEIEERYCEIAARRLAQEVLPLEPETQEVWTSPLLGEEWGKVAPGRPDAPGESP